VNLPQLVREIQVPDLPYGERIHSGAYRSRFLHRPRYEVLGDRQRSGQTLARVRQSPLVGPTQWLSPGCRRGMTYSHRLPQIDAKQARVGPLSSTSIHASRRLPPTRKSDAIPRGHGKRGTAYGWGASNQSLSSPIRAEIGTELCFPAKSGFAPVQPVITWAAGPGWTSQSGQLWAGWGVGSRPQATYQEQQEAWGRRGLGRGDPVRGTGSTDNPSAGEVLFQGDGDPCPWWQLGLVRAGWEVASALNAPSGL